MRLKTAQVAGVTGITALTLKHEQDVGGGAQVRLATSSPSRLAT